AIAHELGQWCVYPDYREIPSYTGVLRPRNLEMFRDSLRNNHMLDQAREFAVASGKLQKLMYKADIETLLRTPGAGGFQLLALQDFPGQGTALEGFLDAFWNSKGVTTPDEFRQFCSETVPLLRLPKLVYTTNESLEARAEIAHFGPAPILRAQPGWTARTAAGAVVASGASEVRDIPLGNAIPLGDLTLPLNNIPAPAKLTLSVYLAGTPHANCWDVWVYPADQQADEGRVIVASKWDNSVEANLRRGRSVLLLPSKIDPGRQVKSAFEPIFWNTQWFHNQPRQLGILCDPRHPAFAQFPNDGHTDWQWWDLLNKSCVMQLDGADPAFRPLVQVIDDWNTNRRLGAVYEARVGKGSLLVCTLDITSNLDTRPAAAALRRSLLQYMNSPDFAPRSSLSLNWLAKALTPP
ncbi:MAG: beta-galactosidase, partial [Candidatus Hydrogenedentes bacterium]|nr:beta-galactosidase [Candidatus Hydrogenedentota bacterium]